MSVDIRLDEARGWCESGGLRVAGLGCEVESVVDELRVAGF